MKKVVTMDIRGKVRTLAYTRTNHDPSESPSLAVECKESFTVVCSQRNGVKTEQTFTGGLIDLDMLLYKLKGYVKIYITSKANASINFYWG